MSLTNVKHPSGGFPVIRADTPKPGAKVPGASAVGSPVNPLDLQRPLGGIPRVQVVKDGQLFIPPQGMYVTSVVNAGNNFANPLIGQFNCLQVLGDETTLTTACLFLAFQDQTAPFMPFKQGQAFRGNLIDKLFVKWSANGNGNTGGVNNLYIVRFFDPRVNSFYPY